MFKIESLSDKCIDQILRTHNISISEYEGITIIGNGVSLVRQFRTRMLQFHALFTIFLQMRLFSIFINLPFQFMLSIKIKTKTKKKQSQH